MQNRAIGANGPDDFSPNRRRLDSTEESHYNRADEEVIMKNLVLLAVLLLIGLALALALALAPGTREAR